MRIMQSYIILKDLRFYAYNGVVAQETQLGNEFVLHLRLRMD